MTHKIVRMPLRSQEDANQFEKVLNFYTNDGFKVVNCGLDNGGFYGWAILCKSEKENDTCQS